MRTDSSIRNQYAPEVLTFFIYNFEHRNVKSILDQASIEGPTERSKSIHPSSSDRIYDLHKIRSITKVSPSFPAAPPSTPLKDLKNAHARIT